MKRRPHMEMYEEITKVWRTSQQGNWTITEVDENIVQGWKIGTKQKKEEFKPLHEFNLEKIACRCS